MSSPDIARLEADLARLREEVEKLEQDNVSFERPATDELAGSALLDAYLADKPFDRHLFSRQPVKIAFLNAAFDKGDVEVITAALFFVRQTLTPAAFDSLLNSVPRFRAAYDRLLVPKPPALRVRRDSPVEERLKAARDSLPQASDFMRDVLTTHIDRLTKADKSIGVLPIDEKWEDLSRIAMSKTYAGFKADSMTPRTFGGWSSGLDPLQAAIMAWQWRMPPEVIQGFAAKADKSDREELFQRKVIARP